MTNEEMRQLAGDINAALRGGEAPAVVERPAALPANSTEGQRRKHAADSEAYTNFILNKRGPMTQDEMIWLATGVKSWNDAGRP